MQHRARLDTRLQAVLDEAAPKPQRVIIRVRPGSRLALRESLTAHGDQILAEHDSLDALTAVVHGEDLGELADKDFVLSVSTDAIVRPHGLLGGLLGIVGGRASKAARPGAVVGNVLLPNGADTAGPTVPPAVLRQTLGVNNSYMDRPRHWRRGHRFGPRDVVGLLRARDGVLRLHEGRHRLVVLRTTTTATARTSPAPSADRARCRSNKDYRGLAPNVKFVVLKVLDKNGAGYTSDVIRAVDFAVANRASSRHPHHQPVARTSDFRAGVERSARPGRRARGARRRDRRRRRRQLRQESRDRSSRLRRHHVTRQCALGDYRRRGQDARHRRAQRRPHRRLQFVGPDVVRRIRQTRRRRARPQHRRGRREAGDVIQDVSAAEGWPTATTCS